MADEIVLCGSNHGSGIVDPKEKVFLFGYSCKLFPYDEKAFYIDQGRHLIPWMGDKTVMIDRYDVRGYLHDLKQYEPPPEGYDEEISEEEILCDDERYRSLRTDMSEEQLYQEEEIKRLRAAVASDGAYHEIGFSYENVENPQVPEDENKVEEPENELYQPPQGLTIPKGMEVPYNMKIHAIVEKTALFVSEQGGQMEIIIKMKQQSNPQFGFMHLDNALYPYYKHLISEIKSSSYKPVPAKKVSQSEDEDEDGHYLHPTLMAGRAENIPKFTVPTINFKRNQDDSYYMLVRNLKHHVKEKEASSSTNELKNEQHCTKENDPEIVENQNAIIEPPTRVRPVIDKMAEYVAKNGEDFETIVKGRDDKRFEFLQPSHEYYNYYIYKRNKAKQLKQSDLSTNGVTSSPSSVTKAPQTLCDLSPKRGSENEIISTESSDHKEVDNGPSMLTANEPDLNQKNVQNSLDQDTEGGSHFESSDSMDFADSPLSLECSKEEAKQKTKVPKGPISFSLKPKESELPSEKPVLIPFLEDDSEDEENPENNVSLSSDTKKSEADLQNNMKTNVTENEQKTPKPNSEFLEAKMAEERIRDKLLATARERLAFQRREKQKEEARLKEEQERKERPLQLFQQQQERELQLERKRKAALFLEMLKCRNPDSNAVVSHVLGSDKRKSSKKGVDIWTIAKGSRQHTVIPGIRNHWDSGSESEKSGPEVPISEICDNPSTDEEHVQKSSLEKRQKSQVGTEKKRKKTRSHSKSKESSHSSKKKRKTKDKYKTRSPTKEHKPEKHKKKKKELPAAFSMPSRSRSRSRSPRRYRLQPGDYLSRKR